MSLFTRFVLIACAAALLASCGSNTGPADVSGTTRDVQLAIDSNASVVALNSDGSSAAVIAGDAVLCLSTASGTEQWRAQLPPRIDRASCRMQFVGTDGRIIVTSSKGAVILDGRTGAVLGAIDLPRQYAVHDNGRFICALSDTSVLIEGFLFTEHDAWTGALLRTSTLSTGSLAPVAMLGIASGVMYIENERKDAWRMYDARSMRYVGGFGVKSNHVMMSVLSPRGSVIATTSQRPLTGRWLTLVDVSARRLISETPFDGSRLLAISPSDADVLIYDSLQSRIVIKDVSSLDEQYEMLLPNDGSPLMRGMACYSLDGRLLSLLATDNMNRRTILRLVPLK